MYYETAEKLLEFLKNSPSSFQAVDVMKRRFLTEGFTELKEQERWKLEKGGRYFVTRNRSALIAFSIPEQENRKFHITASHSDSPSLKIKENPEMKVGDAYIKLNVEKYGGMLMAPWFDRPLSVAGHIVVKENGQIQEKLVNLDRDLLMIPSLAIHMNREINEGYQYNPQKDLLPLFGCAEEEGVFWEMIAKEAGVRKEEILGHDLFLYNRVPGTIWGAGKEFLSAGRLDDLQCAFASMEGFLSGKRKNCIAVHCMLDNEEVGSSTKQGAASTFLRDTLLRINCGLGRDYEAYLMTLAGSFMISADNAHAVHPNYGEKADPVNRPVLNGGIVIKYNANQKYCTDAVSGAFFKELCSRAEVPYQTYVNRSDIPGGSTLGNISNTQVAVNTVDIGLPQLAMHSPYETAGVKDTWYLCRALEEFYA
ncbi:MAG: M18 family aminopeptidase [Eubacteriales bacterium]|nr:M18 family aminopeptidase [Eubacteriales bacterium]